MAASGAMIYHLVGERDFLARMKGHAFIPANLKLDGFVHCAFESQVIPVANDYYAQAGGRVLLLEIDPLRLDAETRHEAPAPIAGGGTSHLAGAPLFPHVYGPIELKAVTRVGALGTSAGGFEWPRDFVSLDSFPFSR